MKKLYFIFIMLVGVLTSCYKPADELCVPCYMMNNTDYMVEHYDNFRLVETWVGFDTVISYKKARVVEMRCVYEINDSVVSLYQSLDTFIVTTSLNNYITYSTLNAGPAVDFDSCMLIINRNGIRSNINTKYVLYRKCTDDTEDGVWIFCGDNCTYTINAETGEVL